MFGDLGRNLYAGARLCFMLPVGRGEFRASLDQAFALLVLGSGVFLLIEFAAAEDDWFPSPDRVGFYALAVLAALVGCFAATRLLGAAAMLSTVVVMLLAGVFWLVPVFGPLFALAPERALAAGSAGAAGVGIAIVLWFLAIAIRAIQMVTGGGIVRPAVAASILVVFTALPKLLVATPGAWLAVPAKLPPGWTQENLYYGQFGMVGQAIDWLAAGRPGVPDVYFVGFAADAEEPVFVNEMRGVTRLFDQRFDTKNRSVVMLNSRATVRLAPLANLHNLGRILSEVGKRMDPEEDVLFLYLSAPSVRDVAMQPSFAPLDFVPISAAHVLGMLDEAKIKWRVIYIASCDADGFADRLRGPTTLVVATAGSGSRGRGCKGDGAFTPFGRTFFGQALQETYSIPDAFARAEALLNEGDEGVLTALPSPVIHVGEDIGGRLDAVAAYLRQLDAAAAARRR